MYAYRVHESKIAMIYKEGNLDVQGPSLYLPELLIFFVEIFLCLSRDYFVHNSCDFYDYIFFRSSYQIDISFTKFVEHYFLDYDSVLILFACQIFRDQNISLSTLRNKNLNCETLY